MKRFLMLTMLAFLAVSVVCGQSKSSKPAKPSGKYAVLQLPAYNNVKNIAEGNSCLYLNTGENVFSVDKVTGEVKVVLTVKDDGTSLYGKDIKAIAADMTSLYYWVGGSQYLLRTRYIQKTWKCSREANLCLYMEGAATRCA